MSLAYFMLKELFAPRTAEGMIGLTEIAHPAWDDPILLTNHAGILSYDPLVHGVTHLGDDYLYAVVSPMRRPDDVPGGQSATLPIVFSTLTDDDFASLALDDNSLNDLIVTQKLVWLNSPDDIVEETPEMVVRSAVASLATNTVALVLAFGRRENEPANQLSFEPSQFGALPF